MHSFQMCLLTLLILSSTLFTQVTCETNAERMRRGLSPKPPKRLYDATRVRRVEPSTPSPTYCSQIGQTNMAIELRQVSDDSRIGYLGPASSYYNTVYRGFGGSGSNSGSLFNVDPGDYSAITVAGQGSHSVCATVNQYNQDLYYTASSGTEPKNYLYNVDCTGPGGYTQRKNYQWDSNGAITLQWLEPPSASHYPEVFPAIWYRSSTNVFRWYPEDVTPTSPGSWTRAYLKWSCVPNP
ncbi:hypothetical protein DFH08DRAFT_894691 [Mycena albidolilacea]|uniref:Uncharacterized protein n=1 Tax=Mycena albidolilacea TaxID=1033008 RepID=A0AAD6ZBQ5_9AGAR|nr:hypothetical protein DFH08DRAFT_894691 [Mycena albidolilacea]